MIRNTLLCLALAPLCTAQDIQPFQAESVRPHTAAAAAAPALPAVTGLRCPVMRCEIEVSGVRLGAVLPEAANGRLSLVLFDESGHLVHQGSIPVGAEGRFTAVIETARLSAGAYKFGVAGIGRNPKVVAAGAFTIASAPSGSQDFFFRTFGLAIPGVAYTTDNHATNTRTVTVAPGAVTKSAVRVNPDGSYVWNSAWDGKLIRGQWRREGAAVILLNAQSGLDWRMERMPQPQGKAVITLWDQRSIWYHGTPLP